MNKNFLKETSVFHRDGYLQMNIYEKHRGAPCHWHDEYEFIYAIKGVCNCVINGDQIEIKKGELLLIQSGELHTINVDINSEYYAIVVHPYIFGAECNKFFSDSVKFNRIFSDKNETEQKIIESIEKIYHIFKSNVYTRELKIKSLFCDIFGIIYDKGLFNETAKARKDYLIFEMLIEYIHKNYATNISLDNLCKLVNYSKPYIINLFKKNTGNTPIDYINRYRIYKSQEMLISEEKKIIDVAFENGFNNVGYFNRTFKKHIGTTPGKWTKTFSCSDIAELFKSENANKNAECP